MILPAHLIVTHILPKVAREDKTTYLNLLRSSKEIYSNITPRDAAIALIAIKQNDIQTALLYAVGFNKIEIIRELIISFGADVKKIEFIFLNEDPFNIPHVNSDTLKLLDSFGCRVVDECGACPLIYIAAGIIDDLIDLDKDMLMFLIEKGADPNYNGNLINKAFEDEFSDRAIELCRLGFEPDFSDNTQMDKKYIQLIWELTKSNKDAYDHGFKDGYRAASKEI